jgi:SSS family solute:Na+ symporter
VNNVPTGLLGLVIAAILSAAMSTISSGMNASATVFLKDIYQRYVNPQVTPQKQMVVLYVTTGVVGVFSIGAGILMIGVQSILDIWWQLAGIFAGGMLGLFLLGVISRSTGNAIAKTATILGILVILWMTFSYLIPERYAAFRFTLHINMVIVVGTLTIFLSGVLLTALKTRLSLHRNSADGF